MLSDGHPSIQLARIVFALVGDSIIVPIVGVLAIKY